MSSKHVFGQLIITHFAIFHCHQMLKANELEIIVN